jgi:hypothetical protein
MSRPVYQWMRRWTRQWIGGWMRMSIAAAGASARFAPAHAVLAATQILDISLCTGGNS